jgi:adenine-specific DNA-methyltransferase
MSRPARSRGSGRREVDDYRHDEAQRLNNPEAGLARYEPETAPIRRYEYDPRIDPQLVWAGKAERTSFDVDAVSIHVHERLSTEAIVRTLRGPTRDLHRPFKIQVSLPLLIDLK